MTDTDSTTTGESATNAVSLWRTSNALGGLFVTTGIASGVYVLQHAVLGLTPTQALPLTLIVLGMGFLAAGQDPASSDTDPGLTADPDTIEEKYNE